MAWVNLDDRMPQHPKIVHLSDGAFRLHISGICYSNFYLTDGLLAADLIPTLMPRYREKYLSELMAKGLWASLEGRFEIHDYLQWNRGRKQVEAQRDRKSRAGRAGAEARWH